MTSIALLRSKIRHGKELIAAKRFEEARLVYQQICAKARTDADSWFTLGAINGMLRRHGEAAECCSKAVELNPRHHAAWYNLGVALRDMGRLEKSAAALRKTLQLDPQHEGAATSLGHVLATLHRYDEAEEVFRGVLRYRPGNAEFYAVYGSAMQMLGRFEAAINAYRKALDMRHADAGGIHENMAAALCLQGKYQESLEHFEAALRLEPQSARYYSSLLLTLHYLVDCDNDTLFDRHRNWPGNALRPLDDARMIQRAAARPDKLRIGYVSSDFRKHSVAYFIEPLLRQHDASRFEITGYFSHKDADATTERLKGLAHRWRDVADVEDDRLLGMIADDAIDILVDLNGHTSGNRLTAFARRAAPVQVSFIGYPDTTGMTEMDYRLTDVIADPLGAERLCTERLARLPGCFLCYQPPETAPDVAPPPCEKNGFVTFGSFNNLAKINPGVIAAWAKLLREIPDSRLIIKNPSLTDKATRERFHALFADAGIANERIGLFGYIEDDSGHLGAYARMDIALDAFPYNGTTTTCEALWMGVPVVSLRGDRHSARVGASLLAAAGCSEWVAETEDQYLRIARTLVQDQSQLAELRSHLRARIRDSRLCSAAEYARAVECAYDEMYIARLGLGGT
ncbi:MAG: tetratricopeptide repeat protein [Gammaproteobacteria bacterium]|nr:tetratricopeptide repeat protein [Gammaproteobacteria bacterium]